MYVSNSVTVNLMPSCMCIENRMVDEYDGGRQVGLYSISCSKNYHLTSAWLRRTCDYSSAA
jgi:hypothetical protein